MSGDETIKSTIDQFGIKIGSHFTQEDTGTNVISLALQQRHPIQLIGEDHYHTLLHEIACYGVPFHYTDEDNLLGSLCIMMPISYQNPLLLTMLSQAVDSIERELLLRKQNRQLNILNQIMLSRTRNGIIITNDIREQVICLFDARPIYEDTKVIGAFGQFRDITDGYLMEKKIKEAEKQALAGRIAAGIAHEIRNPLTTVRGYLQFLEKDVDESTSNLFTHLLIPEIDRANKIISDFLRITKPSYNQFEVIQVQHFIIDYLWKFLNSESLLYSVDFNVEILPSAKYLSILCNREEILQVFINLFQNSVQAQGKFSFKN